MQEYKRINDYVKEIKGQRTVKEFAQDVGIAVGTAIKYLNGKGKGGYKIDILERMLREEAKPQGNVTLGELLTAIDLDTDKYSREKYLYEKDDDEYVPDVKESDIVDGPEDGQSVAFDKKRNFPDREEYYRSRKIYESVVESLLAKKAAKSNGSFTLSLEKQRNRPFDLSLIVENELAIKKWTFDLQYIQKNRQDRWSYRFLINHLGRYLIEGIDPTEKKTIVINDQQAFTYIKQRVEQSGLLPYKGDLSIILYDEDRLDLVEEIYLATYSENSVQFYLV